MIVQEQFQIERGGTSSRVAYAGDVATGSAGTIYTGISSRVFELRFMRVTNTNASARTVTIEAAGKNFAQVSVAANSHEDLLTVPVVFDVSEDITALASGSDVDIHFWGYQLG